MRQQPLGEDAVLLDLGPGEDAVAVAEAARALVGVSDAVPGDACVLVRGVVGMDLAALAAAPHVAAREHELAVAYDGEDLARVAARCGIGAAEVVRRHAEATYRVAYLGFAPGFAYLDGLDPVLHLPRLATPRPRVPAGSVGIAGARTCAYPSASPGGWHLLGRLLEPPALFDAGHHERPALLAPGDLVRFAPA